MEKIVFALFFDSPTYLKIQMKQRELRVDGVIMYNIKTRQSKTLTITDII